MISYKKASINIILITISTILAIGIAEFIVRKAGLSKTYSSYLDGLVILDKKTIYGDRIGYRRIPDSTFQSARNVTFVTNELGFRERKISKTKSGTRRIAFIGDSVTEGFGVEVSDRYTDILSENFKQLGLEYETLNFAVAGHSTLDQYYVLKNFVLQFDPDYLVLQMCINDFKENILDAGLQTDEPIQIKSKPGFSVKNLLQKHSAFYLFAAEKYNYHKLKSNIPNVLLPTANSISNEEWELAEKYLDKIHEISIENQLPLYIMYTPLEVEVLIQDDNFARVISDRIREYCLSRSIAFIDVVNPLRNFSKGKKENLYLDDCHFTVEGNRVVAEVVTDIFKQNHLKN